MKSKIGMAGLLLACGACAQVLSGCGAGNDINDTPSSSGVSTTRSALTSLHPTGAKRDSAAMIAAHMKAATTTAPGALPASVDLTAHFPSPGDQLNEGSCVGWAVGYGTKTFDEVTEEGWSTSQNSHRFSPSWIYNQINNGVDGGSFFSDALNLVVSKGTDDIESFPYVDGDVTTQPDYSSLERASQYKGKSWNTITVSEASFKSVLAGGNSVIVGLELMSDFDTLNTTTNTVYDTDVSTYMPPSRGRHALAIIGYDDNKHAFRYMNSYGTGYGDGGYGWIAYSFITNATLAMDAYVLVDGPNQRVPVDIIGTANVDGDASHRMDIVGVGRPGTARAGHIFVGISSGSDVPFWTWESPDRLVDDGAHVWLADVNGDGKADLVAQGAPGSSGAGWISVGLSDGLKFAHWSWTSGARVVDDNGKVWLADVNGDGKADLVAQGGAGGAAAGWLVVGLSNGLSFPQWSWVSGARVVDDDSKLWLADVNGDGKADLVAQGGAGGPVPGWMLVGLSNGLSFPQWSWTSGGRVVDDNSKVWLADVNGDSKADLVAQGGAGAFDGWMLVGLSNGLSFPQWSWTSGARQVDDASVSFLADMNGDGRADLTTQVPSTGHTYVGLSDGLTLAGWSWVW